MTASHFVSNLEVRKGNHIFYVLDGISYDGNFPLIWAVEPKRIEKRALNLEKGTLDVIKTYYSGPKECEDCASEGVIDGVFVHHCKSCCRHNVDFELHRIKMMAK